MPKNAGFGLLEIVVASALISGTIFSLSFVFLISQRLEMASSNKIRANFLAEEGLEALRFLRDKSWSGSLANLNPGTTYYVTFATSTSSWNTSASNPGKIDGTFIRGVAVASVGRDGNFNILSSGGTTDTNTKLLTVNIAWQEHGSTSTVSVSAYLTNIFNN